MTVVSASPAALAPRDIIRSGLCIGCGGCAGPSTGLHMAMTADGLIEPTGDPLALSARTEAFARRCPFSPAALDEDQLANLHLPDSRFTDPRIGRFEAAFVGAATGEDRTRGSSGGLVTWTAAALLASGEIDAIAHVRGDGCPDGSAPMFAYTLSRSAEALRAGARSRYYPVEMSQILSAVREIPGRYAVIGLPCFIKAVRLAQTEDAVLRERIVVTLGLFCGHMKSARMADSFCWQLGADPRRTTRLDYRIKDAARPANLYTAEALADTGAVARRDWSQLVDGDWGAGFFQASACDMCDDVTAETADIAFGDAWAAPYDADGRGTNVVIARTPVLAGLLRAGLAARQLVLEAVDADFVARTQAAGLRHRREGLAYRLTWPRHGVRPRKRVAPSRALDRQRRRIYRVRATIAWMSHRIMRLARGLGWPRLYLIWAQAALSTYHGVAYGRGRIGALLRRYRRLQGLPDGFPPGAA
jgi:coenzyme F420-reducing hydrogenase beta subunit